MNRTLSVGGQAVIEGVMIRAPKYVATAVRKPNGEIQVKRIPFISLLERVPFLNFPILRGFIVLFETLKLGIEALNFSANVALEEGKNPAPKNNQGLFLGLIIILALGIGILVFFYFPLFLTSLFGLKRAGFLFNFLDCLIRVCLFLVYLYSINFLPDIWLVFQYHGAEHKAIYTYEAGEELTLEKAKKYSTLHPRCGTSFLLAVMVLAILVFSLSDFFLLPALRQDPLRLFRFGVHLLFLPLVAGLSYEFIKLSDRKKSAPLLKFFILPGLYLQKLTTKEPTPLQLEVALRALKEALGE